MNSTVSAVIYGRRFATEEISPAKISRLIIYWSHPRRRQARMRLFMSVYLCAYMFNISERGVGRAISRWRSGLSLRVEVARGAPGVPQLYDTASSRFPLQLDVTPDITRHCMSRAWVPVWQAENWQPDWFLESHFMPCSSPCQLSL